MIFVLHDILEIKEIYLAVPISFVTTVTDYIVEETLIRISINHHRMPVSKYLTMEHNSKSGKFMSLPRASARRDHKLPQLELNSVLQFHFSWWLTLSPDLIEMWLMQKLTKARHAAQKVIWEMSRNMNLFIHGLRESRFG